MLNENENNKKKVCYLFVKQILNWKDLHCFMARVYVCIETVSSGCHLFHRI